MRDIMIYQTVYLLIPLFIAAITTSHPDEPLRDGRWLWPAERRLETVRMKQPVTQIVPSSCAIVNPTLSPCRNVRQLQLVQPTKTIPIDRSVPPPQPRMLDAPLDEEHSIHQSVEPSELETGRTWTWLQSPPMKKRIHTVFEPTTVTSVNPNVVVTFLVHGCQPSKLPFNLPPCPETNPAARKDDDDQPGGQYLDVHYATEEQGN